MPSPSIYLVYVSEDRDQVLEFVDQADKAKIYIAHYLDTEFTHDLAQVTEQRLRANQAHMALWATPNLLNKLTGNRSNARSEIGDFVKLSLRYSRDRKLVALAPIIPCSINDILEVILEPEVFNSVSHQLSSINLQFPINGVATQRHYENAVVLALNHIFGGPDKYPKSPFVMYGTVILTRDEIMQEELSSELRNSETINRLCDAISLKPEELASFHFPEERDEWQLATWIDDSGRTQNMTFPDVLATISNDSVRPYSVTSKLFDEDIQRTKAVETIKKYSGLILIDVISLLLLRSANPKLFDSLNNLCYDDRIRTVLLCPPCINFERWANMLTLDLDKDGFQAEIRRTVCLTDSLSFIGQNRIRELKHYFLSCFPNMATSASITSFENTPLTNLAEDLLRDGR